MRTLHSPIAPIIFGHPTPAAVPESGDERTMNDESVRLSVRDSAIVRRSTSGRNPVNGLGWLLAIALLAAACSGGGMAVAPTAAPTNAPARVTPEPTLDLSLYEGIGVITFGTAYDEDTLLITKETSRFKRTYPQIAWSAYLIRSVGATSMEFVLASQSKSGAERVLISEEIDISNPDSDLFANSVDLAFLLDNKAGTYVMRYIESGEVLAEGSFTLVK